MREALIVGFYFALRICELEGLQYRDISFGGAEGIKCVTILIRGPQTDQQKVGVRRSLASATCDMCPVLTMAAWLDIIGWRPNSGGAPFRKNIADRVNRILKEIAAGNGIDASLLSPHSSSAGCAKTLYSAGVNPEDIQRWGRWKGSIYMRYIWRDNLRFRHLSDALTSPTCLAAHQDVGLGLESKVNFDERDRNGGQ